MQKKTQERDSSASYGILIGLMVMGFSLGSMVTGIGFMAYLMDAEISVVEFLRWLGAIAGVLVTAIASATVVIVKHIVNAVRTVERLAGDVDRVEKRFDEHQHETQQTLRHHAALILGHKGNGNGHSEDDEAH